MFSAWLRLNAVSATATTNFPRLLNKRRALVLIASHAAVAVVRFAAGIYVLPILIAPAAPTVAELKAATAQVQFTGQFKRDLQHSDALHWGKATLSVAANAISLVGKISPGPNYRLYLSAEFVETEADFKRLKSRMVRVGDVNTFENFVVQVPAGVRPAKYSTAIVWRKVFGQFTTAAKYQ